MKSGHSNEHTIELKDLRIGYHSALIGRKEVFGPVNAVISPAEMVGIIGRNGVGKSTLLRTIAGLQHPLNGNLIIDNSDYNRISLKDRARMISYVSTESIHAYQIRVNELIAMGRFPYTGWLGRLNDTDRKAIQRAVELAGVGHLLSKTLHELSDGERQKAMIARALAQDTGIIILDEPTAFLDLPARYEILRILSNLARETKKTVLFSTHDLSIAIDVADKLWVMADNDISQGAPEDLLINAVFRKLFLNSPAEFDPVTSTFRFRRKFNKTVQIDGDKKYRLLTGRAMERIGFKVVDDSQCTVQIFEKEESLCWHLRYDNLDKEFDSIYLLAGFLKKLPQTE